MYLLVGNVDEIVTAISATAEVVDDGVKMNGMIYPNYLERFNLVEVVEVPMGIVGGQYCYNSTSGIYPNPAYDSPSRIKALEEENVQLKNQLSTTNSDLVSFMDYYFANGGV